MYPFADLIYFLRGTIRNSCRPHVQQHAALHESVRIGRHGDPQRRLPSFPNIENLDGLRDGFRACPKAHVGHDFAHHLRHQVDVQCSIVDSLCGIDGRDGWVQIVSPEQVIERKYMGIQSAFWLA